MFWKVPFCFLSVSISSLRLLVPKFNFDPHLRFMFLYKELCSVDQLCSQKRLEISTCHLVLVKNRSGNFNPLSVSNGWTACIWYRYLGVAQSGEINSVGWIICFIQISLALLFSIYCHWSALLICLLVILLLGIGNKLYNTR